MIHKIFYVFIAGFVSGIAFRSFFDFGWSFALFAALLGGLLLLLNRTHVRYIFISTLLFSFALGVFRFDSVDFSDEQFVLETKVDQELLIKGVVVDEPDVREHNTRIIVKPEDSAQDKRLAAYSKILVVVDHYPEFEYGDRLQIRGKLQRPQDFETDTGRTFRYVDYLKKDGIRYQMYYPNTELIARGEGDFVKAKLFEFKHAFLRSVSEIIPEPHASLLGGLVVGTKQALGKELLDDFRTTGLIHIVVLSGYNVTIVADAIMRFLSFFIPRWFAMGFGALSIVLFAIMTGAGATIVRASIMALLVVVARASGRTKEITVALLFAGCLMLLHNPKILIFDPSFQLSFLATLGLIYFAPIIEKYFHFIPAKFQLREFATATVATQFFVLPLLVYMMGNVSIVSIFVNLLVLVVVPMTMFFGFLAGVVGFVSISLATPFAFVAYALLAYELQVVDLFASVPFASVTVPNISMLVVLCTYIFYAVLILRWKKRITEEAGESERSEEEIVFEKL